MLWEEQLNVTPEECVDEHQNILEI